VKGLIREQHVKTIVWTKNGGLRKWKISVKDRREADTQGEAGRTGSARERQFANADVGRSRGGKGKVNSIKGGVSPSDSPYECALGLRSVGLSRLGDAPKN